MLRSISAEEYNQECLWKNASADKDNQEDGQEPDGKKTGHTYIWFLSLHNTRNTVWASNSHLSYKLQDFG